MPAEDRIIIEQEGFPAQIIYVKTATLMIGRDPDHPIPLGGGKVSRNHAVIERHPDGSYTVTDLGSTNGTFMDDAKLLSNVPEPWTPKQILIVGDFRLRLEPAGNTGNVVPRQKGGKFVTSIQIDDEPEYPDYAAGESDDAALYKPAEQGGGNVSKAGVVLEPRRVVVAAGGHANAQVNLSNQGDIVEHYRVKILGLPKEWAIEPPSTLQLLPTKQGSLLLVFNPPKHFSSRAGDHPFELVVINEHNIEVERTQGILHIEPFYVYKTSLEPKRTTNGKLINFFIENESNAVDSYTVSCADQQEKLKFFPPFQPATVAPGQKARLDFEARTRPFAGVLIGRPKIYPFELTADAAAAKQKQAQRAEFEARASFPLWLLIFLMVLLLLLLLLLYFLFRPEPAPPPEEPTFGTATSVNNDIRDLLTATAEKFATLEIDRATEVVVTQTAEALIDSDDDGLSDFEERELGTDPNLDDTDGDGLKDGEEVELKARYECLDPTKDDSDEDGLKDGEEIELLGRYPSLSPCVRDSDGDGLSDGREIGLQDTYPDLSPTNPDTDGDTFNDRIEIDQFGTDPTKFDLEPPDIPENGES
ncbi:MAG: FHA domain-containing protein [Anaerolineales bacterium]|nr:FHA domain-containing protein [Anaerolineales bacterium]